MISVSAGFLVEVLLALVLCERVLCRVDRGAAKLARRAIDQLLSDLGASGFHPGALDRMATHLATVIGGEGPYKPPRIV